MIAAAECVNNTDHSLMLWCPECKYTAQGDSLRTSAREVRVTDPLTGGEKGRKPEEYALLPVKFWAEVARVYGAGAQKYTTYGECNCSVRNVERMATPESYAGATMRSGSETQTPSMQHASGLITSSGAQSTGSMSTGLGENGREGGRQGRLPGTDSRKSSTPITYPLRVESAADLASILTTITDAASGDAGSASGEGCATAAISGWDTSKGGTQNTAKRHEPGCNSHKVVHEGRRNWEKGYAWSLSYSAAQRHLNAFWGGEEIDPETGLHHLGCAAFHLGSLFTFEREGLGTDDRA